jgi:hypothetical protein
MLLINMKVVRKKTWKSRIRKEKVSNRKAWLEGVKLIICSYSCLNKEKKKQEEINKGEAILWKTVQTRGIPLELRIAMEYISFYSRPSQT